MSSDNYYKLGPDSDTLDPLPPSHRAGLTAVAVMGLLSFISTGLLFIWLSARLLRWHLRSYRFLRFLVGCPRSSGNHAADETRRSRGDSSATCGRKSSVVGMMMGSGAENGRRRGEGKGRRPQDMMAVPGDTTSDDLTLGLDQKNFGRQQQGRAGISPYSAVKSSENGKTGTSKTTEFVGTKGADEHAIDIDIDISSCLTDSGALRPAMTRDRRESDTTSTSNSICHSSSSSSQPQHHQQQHESKHGATQVEREDDNGSIRSGHRAPPNQFLLLVYNLFLADMHQATAFLLSARWAASNAIDVDSRLCWTQGWFVSNGDLAASLFVTAVAAHTYLAVVRKWKMPDWCLYVAITGIWVFVYAMGLIGVLITENGKAQGGLYVRATSWCWINSYYSNLRFALHYLWIFISLAVTSALYILIFISLRRRRRSASRASIHSIRQDAGTSSNSGHPTGTGAREQQLDEHLDRELELGGRNHPAFLVYPLIYVVCTAPLALGRVVAMAGVHVSAEYLCVAGAMIASSGWLDVVLFCTTRGAIIFHNETDSRDAGLDTIAFMRTPHTRRYGNMVWVQGGATAGGDNGGTGKKTQGSGAPSGVGESGWAWGWGKTVSEKMADWSSGRRKDHHHRRHHSRRNHGSRSVTRSLSQESLNRSTNGMNGGGGSSSGSGSRRADGGPTVEPGIQMDIVTSVVVEVDGDESKNGRRQLRY